MYQSSSSDSSDYGERLRNVRKLLVKSRESQRDLDEDYAYKQKLGDLMFDANFEAGNLAGVVQVDQHEYDLMVRPDVASPRHKVWFNFRVSNQLANQCVVFNFVNLSENLALVSEAGLTPVVRSRRAPNWARMQRGQVFYYRSPQHNNRRVLSLAFRFNAGHDNEHQFALHYPYTLSALEHFIGRWQVKLKRDELSDEVGRRGRPRVGRARADAPQLRVNTLATSILSKPLYEISISAPQANRERGPGRPRARVVVLGGAAANCESASSLVCQGLVDFALSDAQVARLARAHMDLVVFPLLEPDSIWAGNSRTDLMGQQPANDPLAVAANPALYRGLRLVGQRVESICAGRAPDSATVIELRVNPNLVGARIVGTRYADSLRMERHLRLPRLLSRFSDGFYLERCEFLESRHPLSVGDGGRARVESYRLEVSPFGYHKRSLVDDTYEPYDQARYLLLGKSIVYALLELHGPRGRGARAGELDNGLEHMGSFRPTSRDVDDLILCDAD